MKAALLVRPGELVVDEMPEPEIGPGDVSVAVGGVGLCGSDLSVFSGRWAAPTYPWVMGHEAFGTIAAVGSGVPLERVGQTVVIEPNVACFDCEQCRRGRTSACVSRQSVGMNRPGALAERLVVPARFAWAIGGVPATDLVCVEPTTVVMAALRRLTTPVPASVLVVGVGAQGLLMTVALLERGTAVHVHDINPDRVAFATDLGARRATTGAGSSRFELVVDTVGSPGSIDVALDRLEIGGTLLFLGLDGSPLPLSAQMVVRRQMVLQGSLTYDHPGDFEASVGLVGAGFSPGRIVTDEFPLTDVQRGFARSKSTRGKTWIRVAISAQES